MVKKYMISSLSEYYKVISDISDYQKVINGDRYHDSLIPKLWFRGNKYGKYGLLPTILRNFYPDCIADNTYGNINLREDYRYQHFKARVFHEIDTNPELRSEWLEIYQHHFGNTRMLDWSESAKTALSFAVEPYLDTSENIKVNTERESISPAVWVLNPFALNQKVYDFFCNCDCSLYKRALSDIRLKSYAQQMQEKIKNEKKFFFFDGERDSEISGIIGLGMLEKYRDSQGARFANCVKSFEFNPFYYLVLRLYTDALPFHIDDVCKMLPPLAIIQPYHSERIRTQQGTFTVFPNYILSESLKKLSQRRNIDVREMDRQSDIEKCMCKIEVLDAHRIAKELLNSGERVTQLYPDLDKYSQVIETSKYYY